MYIQKSLLYIISKFKKLIWATFHYIATFIFLCVNPDFAKKNIFSLIPRPKTTFFFSLTNTLLGLLILIFIHFFVL